MNFFEIDRLFYIRFKKLNEFVLYVFVNIVFMLVYIIYNKF